MRHETVFVVAGGPSFVLEDALQAYRHGKIIAVNSSIFSVPFADYLFAADNGWWRAHDRFLNWLQCEKKITTTSEGHKYGAEVRRRQAGTGIGGPFIEGHNSGHQAISLAFTKLGATRIVLLGFDCDFGPDGKKHHHGNHPERLTDGTQGVANPQQTETWFEDHLTLSEDASKKGIEIINCSRSTRLTCYKRKSILEVLNER